MAIMYKRGYMAGKNFEDYIAHEMAHIMPFQNCITAEEYMYTTDVLNLRKSASAKSKLITQIGAGKKVQVISENGKWCQIKYGKDTGYVMKKYLSYSNMLD